MSGAAAGDSQRAELIARILNKSAKGTAGPVLSEEVGGALLRDALSATARPAQLSLRSMGEINEMLSRVRPTTAGVDASYGAAASFGETGPGPPHLTENSLGGKTGSLQFVPFSPGQADFDKTIDNIWSGSSKGETPEAAFNVIGTPHQKSHWEGMRLTSDTFYLILISLAGAILLGVFVFVR